MSTALAASSTADALNATERLREAFTAETITQTKVIDPSLPFAVKVEHAEFSWDGVPPDAEENKKSEHHGKMTHKHEKPEVGGDENVFKLRDVDLTIPRGQLCAIVGPVGSGKSSLLQGMIGEMRRETGTVLFGGSVGYCQQSAWIQVNPEICHKKNSFEHGVQNATIRENICFGRPFEEDRVRSLVAL